MKAVPATFGGIPWKGYMAISGLPGLAFLVAGACAPPADAPSQVVRTDSAGIEIVLSEAPEFPAGTWSALSDPEVLCSGGGVRADPRILQITGVLPIGGDEVAVLPRRGGTVLVCSGGEVVRTMGRPGEGPGELESFLVGLVPWSGDSLAVVGSHSVTVFDATSGAGRSVRMADYTSRGLIRLRPAPLNIVAVRPHASEPSSEYSGPASLLFLSPAGDSIAAVPTAPWSLAGSTRMSSFVWDGQPRGELGVDGYWVPDPYLFSVRLFGFEGNDRILRVPVEPVPVTDDHRLLGRDLFLAEILRSNQGTPREVMVNLADSWLANDSSTVVPAILDIRPAVGGGLWVRVPELLPGDEPRRWRVFAEDGHWVTDVELPIGSRVIRVDPSHVYVVMLDEYDLETIVRYGIEG